MPNVLNPVQFVVIALAGWMNQKQQYAIDYLREENRVLREQLGGRRLRFNDDQRRRLAAKAKLVGRRLLNDIADLVMPDTLLAWPNSQNIPPTLSDGMMVSFDEGQQLSPSAGVRNRFGQPRSPATERVPVSREPNSESPSASSIAAHRSGKVHSRGDRQTARPECPEASRTCGQARHYSGLVSPPHRPEV